MKIKIQTKKFIRNILIGIIALIVVAFIINIAPGYKRNKYKNVVNLVIGDQNVTEKLQYSIYIEDDGAIYIAKEDIKNLIDKTIYYNEENKMIIATSEYTVASMKINEQTINIDGTDTYISKPAIIKDNVVYIPIKEMETVYNIQVSYASNTNIVIIDKLSEGMIKAQVAEGAKVRYKQRNLSKEITKLEEGEMVSAFYTTSKGWRVIRTEDGLIGYVKANILTNEYIVRQDLSEKTETKTINISAKDGENYTIENKKIQIKDLFKITEEGILLKNTAISNGVDEIWANLTIDNVDLGDYNRRTELVKNIATLSRKNGINGINVIIADDEDIERFVIELAPKLNEIGIITNIIATKEIDEEIYTDIVSYIIKN